jgi:hypothetical protein
MYEHMSREILEADFEIAFNLIDLAQTGENDVEWKCRAVSDAEDVLLDIERRLGLLEVLDRQPFEALLGELKRQLARAKCGALD